MHVVLDTNIKTVQYKHHSETPTQLQQGTEHCLNSHRDFQRY